MRYGRPALEDTRLNCAALQIKFCPGNKQKVVLKDASLAGSSQTRDIIDEDKHTTSPFVVLQ